MSQRYSEVLGRFNQQGRKVMERASQEARRFNHEFIGTEHILLGLIRERGDAGAVVLKNLGVDLGRVDVEVTKHCKKGPDEVAAGQLPETPRAKKVLEYALEEAHNDCVGGDHLLLGLLRAEEGIAAIALNSLGITLESVRQEMYNVLKGGSENKGPSGKGRTMINKKMTDAFNGQLNAELYSGYMYLSMSAFLASKDLPGYASWMRVQFEEELEHAMKFYDHIVAGGGKVQLTTIEAPPTEWDGPLAVAEHTLKHEKKVTGLIDDLVSLAKSESDAESVEFLQWYVDEQVEEEENVGKVLEMIKKAGESKSELQAVDSELAKRGK